MTALWIALGITAWLSCGALAIGIDIAAHNALYPRLKYTRDLWPLALLGPMDLSAALMTYGIKHGVSFRLKGDKHGPREAREDHRSAAAVDTGTSAEPAASAAKGAGTGVSIPTETSTEPIQAWKVANLRVDHTGRGVTLAALTQSAVHPIEGTAHCLAYYGSMFGGLGGFEFHVDAPRLGCSCGFYAWKTRDHAVEMIAGSGVALLQVELFGTVIQHEHGYRAQKQRVLGVYLDRRCNGFMCHTTAQWVSFPAAAEGRQPQFKVWCDGHKPPQDTTLNVNTTTVQEIANYLRCEVRWAEL